MWMTTLPALLLPLGIWLILLSATPKPDESRATAAGLLTWIISSLAFAATGFAFITGRGLAVPIAGQAWEVVGSTGFLMDGVTPTSLKSFIPLLALAQAAALLVNAAVMRQTHFIVQGILSAVTGGILFALTNKWLLANGWLAMLGRNLNLGHGAIDLGGLSTVGLVAGSMGLAWAWMKPRRTAQQLAQLPLAHFPFRAVSGTVCLLIGSVALFSNTALPSNLIEQAALGYLINLGVAGAVAGLGGLAYSRVTSQRADVLCAARAIVAAVIMVSSGAGLLPVWVAASLGLGAGLLSTIGLYFVSERLLLEDDGALITTALLPGIIGFVAAGLFANGSMGAGFNGVGAESYLARAQLGIVGLLPAANHAGDPGQFTAQIVAIGAIGLTAWIGGLVVAYGFKTTMLSAQKIVRTASVLPVAQPVAAALVTQIIEVQPAPVMPVVTAVSPQPIAPTQPIALLQELKPTFLPQPNISQPVPQAPPEPQRVLVVAAPDVLNTTSKDGLLDRFRRIRRANLPEIPARARKVAYPTRVNGKRLVRPLVDEPTQKS